MLRISYKNLMKPIAVIFLFFIPLILPACKSGDKKPAVDKESSILYKIPIRSFSESIDANPKSASNYFKRGNALHAIQ